jgi:ABC-2 type transport system ATP-binding protein
MSSCICLNGLSKSYGIQVALYNVSFDIPCGEKWCLLGPNGAGKSTTLKLVMGLLEPDSGSVLIQGQDPFGIQARRLVGYLPEDATPYLTLSVRENLEYIGALRGVANLRERVDYFLDYLQFREYERAKVGALSRGNRQKLAIALALIHDPKILLLDEPLNYLDIPTQESVIQLFKEMKDATFLVSTHIMAIATRLTENVLVLARGRILWQGTMEGLRAHGSETEAMETIVARMMVTGKA